MRAIYPLGGDDGAPVTLSLAADWGTGTQESCEVAQHMIEPMPDFTIHLGDVYYVGGASEFGENVLGIPNPRNNYIPVKWPHGKRGSFALIGNHEMYGNAVAYFERFLPTLGANGVPQKTSFFCVQNQHWRVVGIDTGYESLGLPIISQVPWIQNLPGVQGNCALPEAVVQWLKSDVRLGDDRRGVILLSHHQYYSGFEQWYTRAAEQLWDAGLRRDCLWFWGHEHRLAGYDLYGMRDLKCHGRCIGHGGMPVEVYDPLPGRSPQPLFYDKRVHENGFGVNGFARLRLEGREAKVEYVDVSGEVNLEESFEADASGAVRLTGMRKRMADEGFVVRSLKSV